MYTNWLLISGLEGSETWTTAETCYLKHANEMFPVDFFSILFFFVWWHVEWVTSIVFVWLLWLGILNLLLIFLLSFDDGAIWENSQQRVCNWRCFFTDYLNNEMLCLVVHASVKVVNITLRYVTCICNDCYLQILLNYRKSL